MGLTVKREVWLADIVEPFILELDTIDQLGATVDTTTK